MSAGSPGGLDLRVARAGEGSSRLQFVVAPDGGEAAVEPVYELPFGSRTVARFRFDAALAGLPVRERVQLMLECRRCLRPGGSIELPESGARELDAALARWAALAGLAAPEGEGARAGWRKLPDVAEATPLVSILIPSSNPRYFLECLGSAIAQTHPRIEIVVGDDSRGPEIEAMVKTRAARAPIEYRRNPTQLGARGNYEALLSVARGEFVKFLNDDDLLAPECVAALLRPFLRVPDLTLATSHRQPIDARSRPIADIPATRPVVAHDVIVSGVSLANAMIMYGLNFIGEPSTMLLSKRHLSRHAHLDGKSPFQLNGEEVRGAVDMAMAGRLLVQGDAAFLGARLSSFRRHGEQAQAKADVVQRSIKGIRGLQQQWIELGLFRRVHPNYFETRRLGDGDVLDEAWTLQPVLSFPPTGATPENDVLAWRRTPRHPFDFAAAGA